MEFETIYMDFNRAIEIYSAMMLSISEYHKMEVHDKLVEYARIRTDWFFYDSETRKEKNQYRTLKHNALIDSINSLSRFMGKNNEDNSWRNELTNDRKIIGDWACLIHAYLGIR